MGIKYAIPTLKIKKGKRQAVQTLPSSLDIANYKF